MKYESIDEPSRAELAIALSSGDTTRIVHALLALALGDPDWSWVQERCVECLTNAQPWVRRTAATSLEHLARIHGTLDVDRVMPALARAADNPEDSEYIKTAIDEINWHLSRQRTPDST